MQFRLSGTEDALTVYTTRADTLFGATYMVVSPEHPFIDKYAARIKNFDAVSAYRRAAARKSDFERSELNKEKTGVPLEGLSAINPVTGSEIPIWVSDYVLMSYGTGAIMAVPAHDTRDWEFAKKFGLPIVEVVAGGDVQNEAYTDCHTGVLVNSGFLTGKTVEEAIPAMIDYLEREGIGKRKVNYKLRDWVFTRQRYWASRSRSSTASTAAGCRCRTTSCRCACRTSGLYAERRRLERALARHGVDAHHLPQVRRARRARDGHHAQLAGSSWYFLRYCDPHNDKAFADYDELKYWMPVDWYNGGMEHTTLHLLYSRFWHRFLMTAASCRARNRIRSARATAWCWARTGRRCPSPAAT